MHKYNIECIVLKNINFKDSDKIYTLYTRELGKISAIGKGVRKITSRRGSHLDSLNCVLVNLSERIDGYRYINEAKTIKGYMGIKSDLESSKKAFYITELIDKATQEDVDAENIYDLLLAMLTTLDNMSLNGNGHADVNKFELKLMRLLGYTPSSTFLKLIKETAQTKDFEKTNRMVKHYVSESVGEEFKSLEI